MQNKYKVLLGGLSASAIGAAVAMTGGTSAYFYDSDAYQGNSITACTLGLETTASVVDKSAAGSQVVVTPSGTGLSVTHVQPGDKAEVTITVDNVGECSGDLFADVQKTNETGGIGDWLTFQGTHPGTPAVSMNRAASVPPVKIADLAAHGSATYTFTISAPESGVRGEENEYMGDSYGFNIEFGLAQEGHNPSSGEGSLVS